MKFTLSRSAIELLLRGLFLVFALGSLYGLYDNYTFFLLAPFYFIAFIDISLAALFLYFAISFKTILAKTPKYLTYGILTLWVYTIGSGILGSIFHARALGLSEAASAAGYAVNPYIFSEVLYVVILPSVVFYFILHLLKKHIK